MSTETINNVLRSAVFGVDALMSTVKLEISAENRRGIAISPIDRTLVGDVDLYREYMVLAFMARINETVLMFAGTAFNLLDMERVSTFSELDLALMRIFQMKRDDLVLCVVIKVPAQNIVRIQVQIMESDGSMYVPLN